MSLMTGEAAKLPRPRFAAAHRNPAGNGELNRIPGERGGRKPRERKFSRLLERPMRLFARDKRPCRKS